MRKRIKPGGIVSFKGKAKDFPVFMTGREPGVTWTVQSPLNPVTFKKLKDAKAFQSLLKASTSKLDSVIVRQEITDEGFEI